MSGLEPIMIGLALAGTAASAAGTIISGQSQAAALEYQARQQQILAQWQADQLRVQARQELGIAAAKAREERRQAAIMQSNQLAIAASSGAGATNPTIINLMEETAAHGEYLAQGEMFTGRSRAADLRIRADTILEEARAGGVVAGMTADATRTNSYLTAAGDVASGVSGTYARYR